MSTPARSQYDTPSVSPTSTVLGNGQEPSAADGAASGHDVTSTHTTSSLSSQDSVDLESQSATTRRPSVIGVLRKLSSTFSDQIPPHWKANHINEKRDARSLEDYPAGFPRFAAWMNCDENFLMTRRYGWLHNRVMLYRQSELRELETQLQMCDAGDHEDQDPALRDHRMFARGDAGEYRKKLMQQIDEKLEQYGKTFARSQQATRTSTLQSVSDTLYRQHRETCQRNVLATQSFTEKLYFRLQPHRQARSNRATRTRRLHERFGFRSLGRAARDQVLRWFRRRHLDPFTLQTSDTGNDPSTSTCTTALPSPSFFTPSQHSYLTLETVLLLQCRTTRNKHRRKSLPLRQTTH